MIAYASFLPKNSGIINSALIIALSDGATAFIGGFAVFGTLGYYAGIEGVAVETVLKGGPGLAFVTYPAIINMLPLSKIFGILFFLMLLTLAIDSAFSLVEAIASALRDKFGWNYKKSNILVAIAAFFIGIIFTTGAGLYWLDIVDKWLEVFGLSTVVLLECLVLGWFYKLEKLRDYSNRYSEVKVGKWWIYLLKYFVPLAVAALIISEAVSFVTKGYEGYPVKALMFGWMLVVVLPILAILISFHKSNIDVHPDKTFIPRESFTGNDGYKRLYYYLFALLILGFVLAVIIVLGQTNTFFAGLITPGMAIFVLLALVGGAVYFTTISIKEEKRRIIWTAEHFVEDREEK
jgi:NSS family neurotransmitter:Na+ symporter